MWVVAEPGHKRAAAPPEARLELARAAFAGLPRVQVELEPHGRTADALEARGICDALFVLGADELADFPRWKDPERVLERVRLAVAERPGVPDERVREACARLPEPGRVLFFAIERHPVSSTAIRRRVARGEPIDGLVPPAVAEAIGRLGLYRPSEYTDPGRTKARETD